MFISHIHRRCWSLMSVAHMHITNNPRLCWKNMLRDAAFSNMGLEHVWCEFSVNLQIIVYFWPRVISSATANTQMPMLYANKTVAMHEHGSSDANCTVERCCVLCSVQSLLSKPDSWKSGSRGLDDDDDDEAWFDDEDDELIPPGGAECLATPCMVAARLSPDCDQISQYLDSKG